MNEVNDAEEDLVEYRALVQKVDAAVAAATKRAGDQVTCRAGCSSCCVDGLSVLPVEAFAIASHTAVHGVATLRADGDGSCVFLDDDGRCVVYPVRPLLCRTHGLPLRTATTGPATTTPARGLRVLDDVSVCELNYTGRAPAADEALDADLLLKLLVTVDRRFRVRAAIPDDDARVPLRELAADLTADDAERPPERTLERTLERPPE
jgi:hypothetical protein